MTHRTRQRVLQVLAALTLFATGVGTGAALTVSLISRAATRLFMQEDDVGIRHRLLTRALERRLDLDDEERAALADVLSRYETPHAALLAEHRANMKPLRDGAFEELRQALRPENQRALDQFVSEIDARQ